MWNSGCRLEHVKTIFGVNVLCVFSINVDLYLIVCQTHRNDFVWNALKSYVISNAEVMELV